METITVMMLIRTMQIWNNSKSKPAEKTPQTLVLLNISINMEIKILMVIIIVIVVSITELVIGKE